MAESNDHHLTINNNNVPLIYSSFNNDQPIDKKSVINLPIINGSSVMNIGKWQRLNRYYSSLFIIIIIITMISTCEMAIISTQRHNRFKLVVFSFDGFRPDYIDIERTPNLYAVAKNGVQGTIFFPFFSYIFDQ